MQSRAPTTEKGGDSSLRAAPRAFHVRILVYFLLCVVLLVVFLLVSMSTIGFFGMESFVSAARSAFEPSVDEAGGGGLARWVRPPVGLEHGMTDEELLWRASFDPRVKKYPFERVPKIAFMFLSRGHLPLHPLWERFLKGHEQLYSIYIHSLPSYQPKFPASSPFYRRQIPSKLTEWGRMSMCDAERRLLANALLDISNEWFVLLSESCIPLFNFSVVYEYLKGSQYRFVSAFDDPGPYGRGRYNPKMTPEVEITQWRKGSQWFEVNRELAVAIIADVKFHPKFEAFCQPACYTDEHYFPTMLSIESPHLLANRSVTWTDWSRGGYHPATFGMPDITEVFLRRIIEEHHCLYNNYNSSVCYLFARKFAPSALQPLLHLAPKILGFG